MNTIPFIKGWGICNSLKFPKRNRLVDGARPWVGWGTEFIDLDRDGWLDVIVTNGHVDPNIKAFESSQQHLQPCLIWKNEKGRFRLATVEGEYFGKNHPGRALAVADFDRDGDPDFVIGHQDQPPALLENVSTVSSGRDPVTIRLIGTRSNRDGIGTRLEFDLAQARISQNLVGGGSYLSTHEPVIRESRWLTEREEAVLIWPSQEETLLKPRKFDLQTPWIVVEEP